MERTVSITEKQNHILLNFIRVLYRLNLAKYRIMPLTTTISKIEIYE